jgi:hypothetical protein
MRVVKHLVCVVHWCGSHLEWVYSLNHHTMFNFSPKGSNQNSREVMKRLAKEVSGNVVRTHPYHIHNIRWLWNTLYVLDIDVGVIWNGSTASTTTLWSSSPFLTPSVGLSKYFFLCLKKYSLMCLNGSIHATHSLTHIMVLTYLILTIHIHMSEY